MGVATWVILLLTRPNEFRTLLQFYLYHEQKRDITSMKEHPTSGWDRESMKRCWHFLDMTSRSFSAVIKELEGDLARTICLFYLVLRGLDTIEDDMTIPDHIKQPILRKFHEHTVTPGWNFTGCGPAEKDRQLLVEYSLVVEEVNLLQPEYRDIIIDITYKMAQGMADFAHRAATTGAVYLSTVEEYDLYCHYVAGLVGEGLSRILAASKKEQPWLGQQLELSNSVGIFLQKTNIIRDFREDCDEHRYFWPKEIWGRKEYGFTEMKEMHAPANARRAQWAQSGMILDALRHSTDVLDYLRLLRNQSVFNFCAIPTTMAIATLDLCFMNPTMLQRNIKIRKAEAARLIMRSTNSREVALIFRQYIRSIHNKAAPSDPNFLRLSVTCGKVEQWCEHYYPSFVKFVDSPSGPKIEFDPSDRRSKVASRNQAIDDQVEMKRRVDQLRAGVVANGNANGHHANGGGLKGDASEVISIKEMALYGGAGMGLVLGLSYIIIWVVLRFAEESAEAVVSSPAV